jgi:hypothetical protein
MAELLNCTYCRGVVSSSAKKCPHCGRWDFKDKVCAICQTRVVVCNNGYQQVSLFTSEYEHESKQIVIAGSFNGLRHYCEECWVKLKEIDTASRPADTILACQLCGNEKPVSFQSHNQLSKQESYVCENCGHTNSVNLSAHKVSNCHICRRYLSENLEISVGIILYPSCDRFIHRICYTDEVRREVESKAEANQKAIIACREFDAKRKEEIRISKRDKKRREVYDDYSSWAMFFGGLIGLFSVGFFGVIVGPFIGKFVWWLFTNTIE